VHQAVTAWMYRNYGGLFYMPVVAETYDGHLNDINGFHVKQEHVWQALDSAASGIVAEGNVGGGTGMICHGFKGGTGTASRELTEDLGGYTLGVLVQANHGSRHNLHIAGVPIGREIPDLLPQKGMPGADVKTSSIIVILATDCPLLPHQLKRLAQRIPLGIGILGGRGENYSGDIFLAFSTSPFGAEGEFGIRQVSMYPNHKIDGLYEATVQATEEAIVNALVAAETMEGINGNLVHALPHDRLQAILSKYNRLSQNQEF